MKKWKRVAAMGMAIGLSVNMVNVSFAKQYVYAEPFDVPELTGDWRTDIIAVAESQLGYNEAEDGSTYFGAWIGAGESTQAWCSEFAAWCAYTAKIPEDIFPHKRSSDAYQKYYNQSGQFYFLEEGISPDVSGYGKSQAETISVDQLEPGDILLLESNGNYSDGADHTALFIEFIDGEIADISGNNGGTGVRKKQYSPERVHGVCRPAYDKQASYDESGSDGNDETGSDETGSGESENTGAGESGSGGSENAGSDETGSGSSENTGSGESSSGGNDHTNSGESGSGGNDYTTPVATSSNGSHSTSSGNNKGSSSSKGSSGGGGTTKNKTNENTLVTTGNYVYEGTWVQFADHWKLSKNDGVFAANQWAYLDGKWYIFDGNGQMITGWKNVNHYWYYMDSSGAMKTGWIFVDNKWYCLADSGAMYASAVTPDGYTVDSSGAWVQ